MRHVKHNDANVIPVCWLPRDGRKLRRFKRNGTEHIVIKPFTSPVQQTSKLFKSIYGRHVGSLVPRGNPLWKALTLSMSAFGDV